MAYVFPTPGRGPEVDPEAAAPLAAALLLAELRAGAGSRVGPARLRSCGSLRRHGEALVERDVELEDVDARLADEAESAALGVVVDELADVGLDGASSLRDASHLETSGRRADVRVEAAGGGGDRVGGDGNVVGAGRSPCGRRRRGP